MFSKHVIAAKRPIVLVASLEILYSIAIISIKNHNKIAIMVAFLLCSNNKLL